MLASTRQRNFLRRLLCSAAIPEALAESSMALLADEQATREQLRVRLDEVKGLVDAYAANPDVALPVSQRLASLSRRIAFHLDKPTNILPEQEVVPLPDEEDAAYKGEALKKKIEALFPE